MARETSAFFEHGPHGLQLTQTAREIFEFGQVFRRERRERIPEPSAAEQIERHVIEALVGLGTPVPIPALIEYAREHAAELKPLLTGARQVQPLEEELMALSDDDVIAWVRANPAWLAVPHIAARIVQWQHQRRMLGARYRETRKAAGRLLSRVIGLADRPGRRPARDKAIRGMFTDIKRNAEEIQRAWKALEIEYPRETCLELGRRLHEVLEGTPPRRLLGEDVKRYLSTLGAVVPDRDGKRPVTISDPGWPAAVTFASVEALLGVSKSSIKRSQ
jgi:hypothetical protein